MADDDRVILSVGIDVGTSTTQVVFSRLVMDSSGGFFTVPKVSISSKEVVYKSEVYRTPLKTDVLIDTEALEQIVAKEFDKAGYTPDDTGSGAVIITGESARKENSDAVLQALSGYAGDFVVSAAGPDMESIIAGKGSGACQYSIDHHCGVANLDIGGGTTNVVVFDEGIPIARGCLDIGGRLITVGRGGIIKKVSPAAQRAAKEAGVSIAEGDQVDVSALVKITSVMADGLVKYMRAERHDGYLEDVKTPGSSEFECPDDIEAICFSGGVADLVYHPDDDIRKYGDIGVLLGTAIAESRLTKDFTLISPGETIRATVVGAGSYTTTISGSTIAYGDGIFPLKNIPVIKIDKSLQQKVFEGSGEELKSLIEWYKTQHDTGQFILAMDGLKDPDYREMKRAASVIGSVMDAALDDGTPILLVIECDIAKAMGQMVRMLPGMKRQVVAIDSIHVDDGEYVDMGKPVMNGMVIPVVVKTLIFG